MTIAMAKRVGQAGEVIGFDPFPWNAAATRFSAKLNGLENVSVYAVGIGKEKTTIQISASDSKTISSNDDGFEASILPLSEFASYRPTFIKVDIEGAEADVAEVPFSKVTDRLKAVALEFHPQFIAMRGIQPADVLRKFKAQNLDIRKNGFNGPVADPDADANEHYFVMRPL